MEVMYLACLVADGAKLPRKELKAWADAAAGLQMISEYSIPWVTVDRSDVRAVALEWMRSKEAHIDAAGWNTYSGLLSVMPDEGLDFAEIQSLLDTVVKEIGSAPNCVRCTMNGFVISVGGYVKPMPKQAKAAAGKIGAVQVDVGETAYKIPLALEYIEKIDGRGSVGKKPSRGAFREGWGDSPLFPQSVAEFIPSLEHNHKGGGSGK